MKNPIKRNQFLRQLGVLLERALKLDWDGFKEAFCDLDRYLGQRQIKVDFSEADRLRYQRIGKGVVIAVALLLGLWLLGLNLYGWFWVGARPLMRPAALPAVEVSPTPQTLVNAWSQYTVLSQEEARGLRNQPNAVNLAILNGGATYLKDYGVIFDPQKGWKRDNQPLGFESLSVKGTTVTLTAQGVTYSLNLYQGFAFRNDLRGKIYVVDKDAHIWSKVGDSTSLVFLSSVRSSLPLQIAPNPDLTLTY